jgi:D-xylose transport system substrate-binding protein
MSRNITRSIVILLVLAMVATGLYGCGPAATPAPAQPAATSAPAQPAATTAPAQPAGGKVLVGLSFSDFATERWKGEQVLMEKLLREKGYDVVWQEANHDVKLQNDQIDNMVTQGAKALIVIAEDGDAAVTAVDKAAAAGVKVIAYDRLIKSPNIGAYISFNNTEVGRQEALGVMTALNFDSGKWTKDNPAKIFMMGGSPTDNNAILVRQGQMEVVQPYVDKGVAKIVADQWVDNWDATNALKIMENVLTAQKNQIDAVVASNDGTALGALQALKAQKLAGVVPISGQDATADGCNSIVKGEQTVSVYKDTRLLSPLAVDLADKFLKGQSDPNLKQYTMAELTNDKTKTGNVMAYFLPVVQVTKDNVYDLIVKSGFQSYDDVYRDIPDSQRPPKPGAAAPAQPAGGKVLVGLSFSDFATERWKGEQVLMEKLLREKGYDVVWQEANHDVKLQNDQIDNMVTQGAKALIVIAEDGDAAVTAVDKAAAAGVKVIAYDRLIKSPNIGAYISFNNTEVGRQEALGVMTALNFDSGKWTKDNPAKIFMMGGSPTDNNAILVRQGQMEVVQPYVDKGVAKIVADQWVDNWDATNALKIMENVLTAQKNQIDAVVASNDGTALGALQALKAQKLAGVVPISGQDATADGCNSIVKGEQTVSVYKDTRLLSPLAVDLADKFLKGQSDPNLKQYTMAELTNDKTKTGNVMAYFLPVVQVTKDNVYDLIVKSGFQSYDDVYRDIPDSQRPPKP